MQKFTISFLGRDCPGEVATASRLLGDIGCNIVAATQSILAGEFVAIFSVEAGDDITAREMEENLARGLAAAKVDLSLQVRPATKNPMRMGPDCQPFVVSADGPDSRGEIAAMSRVFARHGVNIESLTAMLEGEGRQALFVFEVLVPPGADLGRLRREIILEGRQFDLRVSMQHRDIFEAMHRITSF